MVKRAIGVLVIVVGSMVCISAYGAEEPATPAAAAMSCSIPRGRPARTAGFALLLGGLTLGLALRRRGI